MTPMVCGEKAHDISDGKERHRQIARAQIHAIRVRAHTSAKSNKRRAQERMKCGGRIRLIKVKEAVEWYSVMMPMIQHTIW